jgi:hypothetical protein
MSDIPSTSRLTADVARHLADVLGRPVNTQTLTYLIRVGQIQAPPKDTAGNYRWLEPDVDAARKVLAGRRPRIKKSN